MDALKKKLNYRLRAQSSVLVFPVRPKRLQNRPSEAFANAVFCVSYLYSLRILKVRRLLGQQQGEHVEHLM